MKLEDKLKKIGNVEKVVSIADVIGTDIPEDVLPDEIKDKLYKDGSTIILATFKDSISDEETLNTVEEIRKVTDGQCKIGGMTATTLDTKEVSNSEVIVYIVIAVILCLVILEIALDSYLIPVLLTRKYRNSNIV